MFGNLFGQSSNKNNSAQSSFQRMEAELPGEVHERCGEGCWFTYDERMNGLGGYHSVNLIFHNFARRVRRTITDQKGAFLRFPGYVEGDWMKAASYPTGTPVIRFTFAAWSLPDGRIVFEWMYQPDGRYYEDDDGFGMEKDEEIMLISLMDQEGHFLCPFQEYSAFQADHPGLIH